MARPALPLLLAATAALSAQTGAIVEGQVVSTAGGTGVGKAVVLLRAAPVLGGSAADRVSYATRTDASGRFAFAGIAPGAYECEASRAGFQAKPEDRPATSKYIPRITLADGQHLDTLLIRLTPLGAIPGRVLDPDGEPVVDADVSAIQYLFPSRRLSPVVRARATTDDRGEFRLYGLYPGTYYLFASPLEEGVVSRYSSFGPQGVNRSRGGAPPNPVRGPAPPPLAPSFYPSAATPAQARAIEVAAGSDAPLAEIHLQRHPLYSIRGKAPDADPALVMVEKRPLDPVSRTPPTRAGNDGTFIVAGLTSGSYVLTAVQRPDDGPAQYARAFVDIAGHDVDGLQLAFAPALRVSGVVKAAGEIAVKLDGLPVRLQPIEESLFAMASALVIGHGAFTFPGVVPDVYHIGIGDGDRSPVYITSIKLGDSELADGELDLRNGGDAPLTITVSADMGSVAGSVTGDDGRPVAAAYVTLIPDQSHRDWESRYRETDADSEGRFAFDKVPPGQYTAFAWQDAPRGAPRDAGFRKPFEKLGTPVTVEPNRKSTVEVKVQ